MFVNINLLRRKGQFKQYQNPMKKLSFKKAAAKVLQAADEPLSANEITQIALDEDMISTSGATPEATMAAQLYTDINNNPSTQFKKVGRGLFALKQQTKSSKSPLLAIQNQNELVRKNLKEKIHEMDPFQFEYLVANLLEKIGYENVEVTARSGDKGIDIVGDLTVGGLTDVKTVIQVKRYSEGSNISGRYITQLRGSAAIDQRGLIITTSNFTKSAIDEAKAVNKMPVALVNGEKLIDLLLKYKVGVKEEIVSVYSIDSELFGSEITGSTVAEKGTKSRAIWPLPGGINSFLETLNLLLDHIDKHKSTRESLVTWFVESFDSVNSRKGAQGYLTVPRSMGLVDYIDGVFVLTEAGKNYRETHDKEFLFETMSRNLLAFEEIHQFLLDSPDPKSDKEIFEYITDNFDVSWETMTQVHFRLLWLINLGKVEKTSDGYVGR